MLKNLLPLLPKILQKQKNAAQKLKPSNTPTQEDSFTEGGSVSENKSESPNLLPSSRKEELLTHQVYQYQSHNYLKTATLTIQMTFLTLILLNALVDSQSNTAQKKLLETSAKIQKDIDIEQKLYNITKKISEHKRISSEIEYMYPKVEAVVLNVPPEMKVISMDISPTEALTQTEAPSALSYALLINKYYESQFIKDITIRSASRQGRDQSFKVELRISLK